MSGLEASLEAALEVRPDVTALAWVDGRAGLLLGMAYRGDVPRELVESAAYSAPLLLATPTLTGEVGADDVDCPDSFVTSESWVHAYARVPAHPDFVVMGLAPQGTNVALLRAWLGEVAAQVARVS